jgi:hypothetical protein
MAMKSIVCVNTAIPTVDNVLSYVSDGSLRDYDIVVFDPELPWESRINFDAGGSCISIEGAARLNKSMLHWSRELRDALAAGKTVFVLLCPSKDDQVAVGSTMTSKNHRAYQTTTINNYSIVPGKLRVRNARGRGIGVKDSAYKGLYDAIREIVEYRVVFESSPSMHTVFTAKDGTAVGGVLRFQEDPGSLVLLPYFNFENDEFTAIANDEEVWTKKALNTGHALVRQLVAIDRMLGGSVELTPPPEWLSAIEMPKAVAQIEAEIAQIDVEIEKLRQQRDEQSLHKANILEYSHLLYETGKPLERAIEKALRLLGYTVETLRIGDLEIDHIVVGPSGKRMIGESEGKDTSAVDISKFRQLESNIGEDFEREEVDEPAKGLLFGNGFRLSDPKERPEQFTRKSLTNAARLGSALIRTADLYAVALHLLDHPDDDAFRTACRVAIEETAGGIVAFPDP